MRRLLSMTSSTWVDQGQTIALLVSFHEKSLEVLLSKIVRLWGAQPHKISPDYWKESIDNYLGIDLLQKFSLFFYTMLIVGKGTKHFKSSILVITVKRLRIPISSTSREQILIHVTCVKVTIIYLANDNINNNSNNNDNKYVWNICHDLGVSC